MVPSITDWIQAIGVLIGVPISIYGIWKLFWENKERKKEDKKRDEEISALKDIALSQNAMLGNMNAQLIEVQEQTKQIQYQSFLFKDSNDILKEQVELMNKIHVSDKEYKEKSQELENRKRKSEIKPYFKMGSGSSTSERFEFIIINSGNQASYINIEEVIVNDIYLKVSTQEGKVIESNEQVHFYGNPKGQNFHFSNVTYEFDFIYADKDGNKYKQNITGKGGAAKIGNPEEIK